MMIGCLLFAARLVSFWQSSGVHPIDIHVDFFTVYSTSPLITANQMNLCSNIPHLCTVSILNKATRFKDFHGSNRLTSLYLFVILCDNSRDIESNPGPDSCNGSSHFPYGVWDADVGWEHWGICCDTCTIWYHIDSQGMSSTMYSSWINHRVKILYGNAWNVECQPFPHPYSILQLFWKPTIDLILYLHSPTLKVWYQI